jgi:hypothetical protein
LYGSKFVAISNVKTILEEYRRQCISLLNMSTAIALRHVVHKVSAADFVTFIKPLNSTSAQCGTS